MGTQMFPVITKAKQEAYKQSVEGTPDNTPEICGYYGRGCRRMDYADGARLAICRDCALAKYVSERN